jgi:hypothetical protein
MKNIRFVELTANEQETLQGGGNEGNTYVVNNVTSGSSASASQSQAQGQQGAVTTVLQGVKQLI